MLRAQRRRRRLLVQRAQGQATTTAGTSSRPRLDQPVRRPGHLRVARAQPADRHHRVARGDGPRHHDRLRPRPLPLPGPLGDQPAHLHADGHARGRHGLEPADALPHARACRPARTAILIAHIMFCVSFVVVAVKARVATLDPRLEEAAADLGANPTQTFLRVTLPLAAPGIAAGALLAFSLSASTTTSSPTSTRARARSPSRCTSGAPPQRGVPGADQRHRHGHVPARPRSRRDRPGRLSSRRNRQVA